MATSIIRILNQDFNIFKKICRNLILLACLNRLCISISSVVVVNDTIMRNIMSCQKLMADATPTRLRSYAYINNLSSFNSCFSEEDDGKKRNFQGRVPEED